MTRRILIGLGIGVSATVIAWALSLTPLAESTEGAAYDLRLRWTAPPAPADSPIAVIEINESSIRALEASFGRWPWPRIAHAVAIDFLKEAGAKVIAYDVLFTERDTRGEFDLGGQRVSGSSSDAAFVESVAAAGNVILLSNAVYEGLADREGSESDGRASTTACPPPTLPGTTFAPGPGFMVRPCLDLPFVGLAEATAGVGHNFLVVESIAQREFDPFIDTEGVPVPALGLAAALLALGAGPADVVADATGPLRIGSRRLPLHQEIVPGVAGDGSRATARKAALWFRRPVQTADGGRETYPSYSFFDVLLSVDQIAMGKTPAIDPAVFRDKVVFIGTTAQGLFDVVKTPFDQGGVGGVHLHATLADNVLTSHFMGRARPTTEFGITLATGIAVGLAATFVPVVWATPVVLLSAGLLGWALTRAVGAGLWIAAVPPLSAAAVALFGGVAWQYFVEGRAKREVRRLFGRFVSKDIIAQLESDPSKTRLGGERRQMSVLFSDIRGFTAATEVGTPEDVVDQLNEYFTAMVDVLFRHRGTLDKFVGDMVMGLFGAPQDDPQHADHAVAAARDMVVRLNELNVLWQAQGRPPVDIGIGINSGEMIAGNIGSEAIMSYTVIGDAVNLAARLESLNKEHGTRILISEATRAALTTSVETRLIGEVKVKGKSKAVVVHQVLEIARES